MSDNLPDLPDEIRAELPDELAVAKVLAWGQRCAAVAKEPLEAEAAKLRTVMVAAAEEIHDHWDAHCDAEGYGPANLMRRLEDGIPSEYGYTAGAFRELKRRIKALEDRARVRRITDEEIDKIPFTGFDPQRDHSEAEALRRFARAVEREVLIKALADEEQAWERRMERGY